MGEVIKNPIHSKDAPTELQIEKKTLQLSWYQKCRVIWSIESCVVSLLMLFVGVLNLFIFNAYEMGFNRKGLWVFFMLGILPEIIVGSFVMRTFIAICFGDKRRNKEKENMSKGESGHRRLARITAWRR